MPTNESDRQRNGRTGAIKSWANTPDRSARTRKARGASPSDVAWHDARLDPERFAGASVTDRRKAAEAAKRLYFLELAAKSAASRRNPSEAA